MQFERVTERDVEAFRSRLVRERRLSDRTINKLLTILHGIFAWGQRSMGLSQNPVAGVERQPVSYSGELSILTPDEIEALAEAAKSEQDAALFRTAAYTGLRLGELKALRICDLDFARSLIHVCASFTHGQASTPKSGKVRSVPRIDQASAALAALIRREWFADADDLVFPGARGSYMSDTYVRKRFTEALARAGLKKIRFHDLRHVFGSLAVQEFPLTDVQVFMGHADIQTTRRYIHHVPQRDAADRLTKVFETATGGDPVGRQSGRELIISDGS